MKRFGLGKAHKLCSTVAVERLFSDRDADSAIAFPVRAVWHRDVLRRDGDERVKFLISIPKKRLRHAVDRVAMRRRVREAYRLNHAEFEAVSTDQRPVDVAFVYVANELKSYASVERAMRRLLAMLHPVATVDEKASEAVE